MDSEADDDKDAGEAGEAVEASDGGPHMYLRTYVRMVPYTYMLAVMLTGHTAAAATATRAATASGSDKESEMVLCDGGRRGRRLSLAAPCSSGSSDYIRAG